MIEYNVRPMLVLLSIIGISTIGTVHAQTANEIDIATGAGGSANAACVATNNCFSPNPLTVAPGTTVTWKNTDAAMHVICSGKPSDAQCGSVFEEDSLKPGQIFQFTFNNSGTYDYYCSVHPWMTGQVIVGTGAPVPTPIPQPTPVSISLNTDMQSYNQGDTIIVTGKVSASAPYSAVTVKILNTHSNLLFIGQLLPASDGSFTKTFSTTGPYWVDAGTYTIIAQYGLYTNATTHFYYNGSDVSSTITKAINATYGLQSGNQIYNIPYIIKGGAVSSMSILSQQHTLEITSNTNADGSLTITIPRSLMDAKAANGDINFIVTVGGQITQFSETANSAYRILSIPFHNGDSKIDIIGTQIANTPSNTTTTEIPYQPVAVTATAISPTSIILNWSQPQNSGGMPITGYQIYYRVAPNTAYMTLVTLGDVTTYTHTNLATGKTYIYRISAINTIGTGNPSAEVLATPVPPTIQPTNEIDVAIGAGSNANAACVSTNNCFTPNPLTVAPGTTVTWRNTDTLMHVVCSGKPSDAECGKMFEEDSLKPGKTFQFTFADAGTYDYFCSVHPWMTGQVIVGSGISTPNLFTPTQQDIASINQAKANQTIAAEVNIGTNTNTTSIDNNVSIKTTQNTPDSLGVQVSATNQTGPKVIAFNLAATTINVANLKDLGIMYDGKLISPAPNMDAILHAKPTDNPSFAIVVTQSGIQVLVLVPHFSTHTITITNMTKVIPAVPEFPGTILVLIIATLSMVLIPKVRF